MFYAEVSLLKPPVFKRLTGVSPDTFAAMSAALEKHPPTFGRPPKLCREDRLLTTLVYWRERCTYVHTTQTYGLSDSAVCRTIRTVEDALVRCGEFTLPGKKVLTQSGIFFEVVVVDATECSAERPQKSRSNPTAARKSGIREKPRPSPTPRPDAS